MVSRTSAILPGCEVDEEDDKEGMMGDWVGVLLGGGFWARWEVWLEIER